MRVTRRSEEKLADAAVHVPPMAYDLSGFCKLEILHATIPCSDADNPAPEDGLRAQRSLGEALEMARLDGPYLAPRLQQQATEGYRDASREVRMRMQEMWAIRTQEKRS